VILLCGIPTEEPLRMVRVQLDKLGARYVLFNQRDFGSSKLSFAVDRGQVRGELHIRGSRYLLSSFQAIYTRLMDDRSLPELQDEPEDSPLRLVCRGLHEALNRWMEISPALVVNRCSSMGSNSSKPYQCQLIRRIGFLVPETLVTSNPDRVSEFRATHGRIIYKSISSVRSIVHTFEDSDLERIERIRWCPTQFQAYVEGTNIRVHVVGERVYATAINSNATDYRYAGKLLGVPASMSPTDLSDELAARCVKLARSLGLVFAGIDLKITRAHEVYCFEVNPSPAFSFYESNTGQAISEGLALALRDAEHTSLWGIPRGEYETVLPASQRNDMAQPQASNHTF